MLNKLTAEDQRKVDDVTGRGVNSVERAPFRGWLLLGAITAVMTALSIFSYWFAWYHGLV